MSEPDLDADEFLERKLKNRNIYSQMHTLLNNPLQSSGLFKNRGKSNPVFTKGGEANMKRLFQASCKVS